MPTEAFTLLNVPVTYQELSFLMVNWLLRKSLISSESHIAFLIKSMLAFQVKRDHTCMYLLVELWSTRSCQIQKFCQLFCITQKYISSTNENSQLYKKWSVLDVQYYQVAIEMEPIL